MVLEGSGTSERVSGAHCSRMFTDQERPDWGRAGGYATRALVGPHFRDGPSALVRVELAEPPAVLRHRAVDLGDHGRLPVDLVLPDRHVLGELLDW